MKRTSKNLTKLLSALTLVAGASITHDVQAGDNMVGIDFATLIPVDDFGDRTGPLLGPLLHLELPSNTALALTARAGYLFGLSTDTNAGIAGLASGEASSRVSVIPVWAGAKAYFMGKPEGPYAAVEIGLNYMMLRTDGCVTITGFRRCADFEDDNSAEFGMNLGLGYRYRQLDLRSSLAMLDLGNAGKTMGLLFSAGISFATF